jgi:hypothetical protein
LRRGAHEHNNKKWQELQCDLNLDITEEFSHAEEYITYAGFVVKVLLCSANVGTGVCPRPASKFHIYTYILFHHRQITVKLSTCLGFVPLEASVFYCRSGTFFNIIDLEDATRTWLSRRRSTCGGTGCQRGRITGRDLDKSSGIPLLDLWSLRKEMR